VVREVQSDEARKNWRGLLNEVEHRGEHIILLRYTTPSAVLVPVGWYERALATLGPDGAAIVPPRSGDDH
jgi:antitoxin (DNA-binding transcriptional repressor) of toxin-antitoxin stability system